MRPRRLLRLLSDFDCKIRYHSGKASVTVDALSRNERAKTLKVRALVMNINSNLPPQIHKAQVESLKTEKVKDENLHGMDKELRLVLIELSALGPRLPQWPVMEEGITTYVSKCLMYLKMRNYYLKPSGLLLDEIQIDDMFHSIEEPVVIMDHEVKRLKVSRIPIVKVCWTFRRGPEYT
ncbi:hypothetical protein Tco_0360951 [Tanacetum coccineum]